MTPTQITPADRERMRQAIRKAIRPLPAPKGAARPIVDADAMTFATRYRPARGDRREWSTLMVFSTRAEALGYCDLMERGWFSVD